jgi:hypothetical protein
VSIDTSLISDVANAWDELETRWDFFIFDLVLQYSSA